MALPITCSLEPAFPFSEFRVLHCDLFIHGNEDTMGFSDIFRRRLSGSTSRIVESVGILPGDSLEPGTPINYNSCDVSTSEKSISGNVDVGSSVAHGAGKCLQDRRSESNHITSDAMLKTAGEKSLSEERLHRHSLSWADVPMRRLVLCDIANIITIAGCITSILSIVASTHLRFKEAISFLMISTFMDWADGYAARIFHASRSEIRRNLGVHLDSTVDVINYAVAPSCFLLNYSNHSPMAIAVACLYSCAVVTRLSYFNLLSQMQLNGTHYIGLSSDSNAVCLAMIFLLEPHYRILRVWGYQLTFDMLIAAAFLVLATLNTSTLKVPKFKYGSLGWCASVGVLLILAAFYGQDFWMSHEAENLRKSPDWWVLIGTE